MNHYFTSRHGNQPEGSLSVIRLSSYLSVGNEQNDSPQETHVFPTSSKTRKAVAFIADTPTSEIQDETKDQQSARKKSTYQSHKTRWHGLNVGSNRGGRLNGSAGYPYPSYVNSSPIRSRGFGNGSEEDRKGGDGEDEGEEGDEILRCGGLWLGTSNGTSSNEARGGWIPGGDHEGNATNSRPGAVSSDFFSFNPLGRRQESTQDTLRIPISSRFEPINTSLLMEHIRQQEDQRSYRSLSHTNAFENEIRPSQNYGERPNIGSEGNRPSTNIFGTFQQLGNTINPQWTNLGYHIEAPLNNFSRDTTKSYNLSPANQSSGHLTYRLQHQHQHQQQIQELTTQISQVEARMNDNSEVTQSLIAQCYPHELIVRSMQEHEGLAGYRQSLLERKDAFEREVGLGKMSDGLDLCQISKEVVIGVEGRGWRPSAEKNRDVLGGGMKVVELPDDDEDDEEEKPQPSSPLHPFNKSSTSHHNTKPNTTNQQVEIPKSCLKSTTPPSPSSQSTDKEPKHSRWPRPATPGPAPKPVERTLSSYNNDDLNHEASERLTRGFFHGERDFERLFDDNDHRNNNISLFSPSSSLSHFNDDSALNSDFGRQVFDPFHRFERTYHRTDY